MGKSTREWPIARAPGHDGHAPEFVTARDFPDVHVVDQSGQLKREKVNSPQNINIDRIEWMYAHRQLSYRQAEAARRLQKDWELSLIAPTASNVLVGASSGGLPQLPNDTKVDAMKRWNKAREACGVNWGIVDLVVHKLYSVEKAASAMKIDRREAKGRLWSVLHSLADHYGFPRDRSTNNETERASA